MPTIVKYMEILAVFMEKKLFIVNTKKYIFAYFMGVI